MSVSWVIMKRHHLPERRYPKRTRKFDNEESEEVSDKASGECDIGAVIRVGKRHSDFSQNLQVVSIREKGIQYLSRPGCSGSEYGELVEVGTPRRTYILSSTRDYLMDQPKRQK